MSHKSIYVDGKMITGPQLAFEEWLLEGKYCNVADDNPFGVDAVTLLDDFLDDNDEYTHARRSLYKHADDIGKISDSDDFENYDDYGVEE